jgi:hypothetical protein
MSTQDSTKTTQSSAFTSIGVTSSRGSFTFLGLLAFSFAELGFANLPNEDWSTLLLRLLGWEFMFYMPVT